MRKGSLYIVGCGLRFGQSTLEAKEQIEKADKVLHLAAEKHTIEWLKSLHGNVETLMRFYEKGKPRKKTYDEMVDRILFFVRQGWRVCVVMYGHPGVFVDPTHRAIRIAREEGYEANMFPGISAEDCLFADLGVDPSSQGCQSFETTRFLVYRYIFDPRSMLILWQVGVIGIREFQYPFVDRGGLAVLVDYLTPFYGPSHEVTVYEAAAYRDEPAKILRMPLAELNGSHVTVNSTLMIPPKERAPADQEMRRKLGLS